MSIQVNNSGLLLKAFRLIFKVALFALNVIVAIASDEHPRPRYTAAKAKELYEDDAISGTEYARCIHGDGW